ncbi:MAG TPA: anti-virulence regulator CigR family protein [Gemmatimonadales bacterium]|nr:anti-virulence regulator CigR family protein [Gemmatimonadales bacterium]
MVRLVRLALVVALASSVVAPGMAEGQGRAKGKRGRDAGASAGFTAAERDVVTRYYAEHPYAAKPLPPGIAKKLARGKPLPPGIAKRALPPDLVTELPPRAGFEVSIVGDRVVLLDAQGLVVDVLVNVFR